MSIPGEDVRGMRIRGIATQQVADARGIEIRHPTNGRASFVRGTHENASIGKIIAQNYPVKEVEVCPSATPEALIELP